MKRQQSGTRRQDTFERQPTQPAKPTGPVEIPADLSKCTAKELNGILDGLGIKRDDCFEKADLVKRVEEYQATKQSKRKEQQPSSSGPHPDYSAKSTFVPSGNEFTLGPKPDHICFKITSVGNQEVGKSCLIKRYCEGRFVKRYISTIGVDYGVKN